MIIHYLKIAWRNLLKYKTQSVISIIGLAIGFTAFSFTLSWIRYERGYDKHIQDADKIFKVLMVNERNESGVQFNLPAPLKGYLENLPEVEAATIMLTAKGNYANRILDANMISTDTSFFNVFYPDIRVDYPDVIPDNQFKILTEESARQMGFSRMDIGQHKQIEEIEFTLLDIIPGLPHKQTNIPFDVMVVHQFERDIECPWCYHDGRIFVRIRENVNVETLAAKLESILIEEGAIRMNMSYILVPLREVRYTYPEDEANIRYHHLRIFAGVSVLVILCALFNWLMLFINKIKLRGRELALRKVNGASIRELITLLLVEMGLIVLSSLFIGGVLSESLYPWFLKLSGIEASKLFLMREMIGYGITVFGASLLCAVFPIYLITRKSVSGIIQPETKSFRGIKNRSTLVSLLVQLIIGTLLIFCTLIFLHQYKHLNSMQVGFDRFNVNTFQSYTTFTKDEIRKIAGVEDVVFFQGQFLPRTGRSFFMHETEFGEKKETEILEMHQPDFIDFFDFKIVEGRSFHEGEMGVCLINETAKREYGFMDPIGKTVNNLTVIGVIADMYIDAPSMPVLPTIYRLLEFMSEPDAFRINRETGEYWPARDTPTNKQSHGSFAYRYVPGHRESTEKAIKELAGDNGGWELRFSNMEEVYAEYTRSENYLLTLLSIMTVVAILIAVFGIYSMVTLACNQRRKEIAIRKVNGAKVREIFMLFFRQYFVVTVLSCIVAFPVGVYIMQRWLEQYTRRVSMEWWLFVGIFVLVLLIVLASIFSRVSRASKENPADVVKSE